MRETNHLGREVKYQTAQQFINQAFPFTRLAQEEAEPEPTVRRSFFSRLFRKKEEEQPKLRMIHLEMFASLGDDALKDRDFCSTMLTEYGGAFANEDDTDVDMREIIRCIHPSLINDPKFFLKVIGMELDEDGAEKHFGRLLEVYQELPSDVRTDIEVVKRLLIALRVSEDHISQNYDAVMTSVVEYVAEQAIASGNYDDVALEMFRNVPFIMSRKSTMRPFEKSLYDKELFEELFSEIKAIKYRTYYVEEPLQALTRVLPEDIKADPSYMKIVINVCPDAFALIDSGLKSDRKFVSEHVEDRFEVFQHASYNLRNDPEIVNIGFRNIVRRVNAELEDGLDTVSHYDANDFVNSIGKDVTKIIGSSEDYGLDEQAKKLEAYLTAKKLERELTEKPKSRAAQLLDDVQGDKPKQTSQQRPMRHKL